MCDWEDQKRLVTINLSVDFRLLKSVIVRKGELLLKTGKNANLLAETPCYGTLRMTTISNHWPHVGHCKVVSQLSSRWRGELVSALKFYIFLLIYTTRHSYQRINQNVVLEWSCRILSSLRKAFIVIWLLRAFYAAMVEIKCTFANWCLFYVFVQPGLFYNKYLSQLQKGSILKRSPGKKLSKPGRVKTVLRISSYGNSGVFQY